MGHATSDVGRQPHWQPIDRLDKISEVIGARTDRLSDVAGKQPRSQVARLRSIANWAPVSFAGVPEGGRSG